VVQWLLEAGADANCLDRHERTPLEEAVRNDHIEVVKLLQHKGGAVYQEGAVSGACVVWEGRQEGGQGGVKCWHCAGEAWRSAALMG
jgi:ankyrin repeat protein